jgi:hypothetical protein
MLPSREVLAIQSFSFAAFKVFINKPTLVISPTPPGTGVIADAISFIESKSTSPFNLPFTLFIPTSTTTAPFFIKSAFI